MNLCNNKTFLHIITDYPVEEWNVIKERYFKEKEMNLTEYQPVFLKITDFSFPFGKQATLIINEWRKYKKIGVVQVDNLNELDLLDSEQALWLKSNTIILLKHQF